MKEIHTMDACTENQAGADDLFDTMHQIDRSFCSIYEGGNGVGHLGDVIPFDDAAVFADVMLGRDGYYTFRDCLERSSGVRYIDLFDMDRGSVDALQASLPDSTVQEILHYAREARAGFRVTCQALATAITKRMLKIKFDRGDGLSAESFSDSWHSLCSGYSSLRHLKSDLRDGAWLNQEDSNRRWKDLQETVLDAILAMRECFDWDELAYQRSEGRPQISWPRGTDDEEALEEVKTLLAQAGSKWDMLRAELFREVDRHFEPHLTGWDRPSDENGDDEAEADNV
jgi:hypothetical protein